MAGAAGGIKGVPDTVAAHPLVFATFTAPSFGLVHAAKKPGRPGSRRCLPRTGDRRQVCPHGRPRWCMTVHDHLDPQVGQPLCADCYDYIGHLIWQWWAPELWRRFTIALRRRLARHLGLSETAARQRVRVQFAKVAEFQRRGIIHFHALIRLDGPPTDTELYPPPAVEVDSDRAGRSRRGGRGRGLVRPAADRLRRHPAAAAVRRPAGRPARHRHRRPGHPRRRSCTRKRSPRTSRNTPPRPPATCPPTSSPAAGICRGSKPPWACWPGARRSASCTGAESPYKGWDRWVDMLGFRGHFATKSHRYSTTLGRLRQARRDYTRRHHQSRPQQHWPAAGMGRPRRPGRQEDTTLVIGSWRFAGMGWLTTGDAALAARLRRPSPRRLNSSA